MIDSYSSTSLNSFPKMIFYFLLVVPFVAQSHAEIVRLFTDNGHKGSSLNITMEYGTVTCINFPDNWLNLVSSINSGGLCVELYSEKSCGGKKIVLYPQTHHYNLAMWFFDKISKSIRVCDKVIDMDHPEHRFSILVSVRHSIKMSDLTSDYHMNVYSCETLPTVLRSKEIEKIDTYKTCFRYFSEANCTGKELKPTEINVIRVITDKNILKHVVSLGRCGYFNITRTTTEKPTTSPPTTMTSPQTTMTSPQTTTTMSPATAATTTTTMSPTTTTTMSPATTIIADGDKSTERTIATTLETSNADFRKTTASPLQENYCRCPGSSNTAIITICVMLANLLIMAIVLAVIYIYKKNNSKFSWGTVKFTSER